MERAASSNRRTEEQWRRGNGNDLSRCMKKMQSSMEALRTEKKLLIFKHNKVCSELKPNKMKVEHIESTKIKDICMKVCRRRANQAAGIANARKI